jgi:hypothetical protein
MRSIVLACVMGTFACSGAATAAEVIYSSRPADRVVVESYGTASDDEFDDAQLSYNDDADAPVVRGSSRRTVVIQDRPLNCGTYKYWDGETCADARDR